MIKNGEFSSSIHSSYRRNNLSILKKRLKQNKLYILIIAITLAIGMILAVFQPGIGYEIVVNDNHIGFTKHPKEIMNVLSSLDKDLRITNGKDIKYDMDVRFVKGKIGKNKIVNIDDLKIMVSSILSIKKPAFILKTDDGIAFAIDSKESMQNIIDGVKAPFMEGKKNATAEVISNTYLIKSQNVPVDKILNYNQAMTEISKQKSKNKSLFDVKVSYTQDSTRPIKRGVTTVSDSTMYEGESRVKDLGSDGIKQVTSKITEINGTEVDSNVINEKVIQAPVSKIILVGTKPKIPGVLQIAYRYLGVPYVWGGTTPRGFDCSGFVQYVYRQRGVYLPRTTYEQVNVGRRVSRANLRPGDLCHFPGHVGIYVGGGQMIHAPRPGDHVRIASVDTRNFLFGTRVE